MNPKITNFALIVGAGKCGTTSLFNYLAQHPEVAPCNIKEPNFFCRADEYAKGFDYYQSLWNWQAGKHKIALEASVNYSKATDFHLLNASQSIKETQRQYNFKFKIIYLIRNPLERIQSEINYSFYRGYSDDWETFSAEAKNTSRIDTSRYAMQLAEYYQRFSSEDILILNFALLKSNPALVVSQVCQFLQLDSSYEFKDLGRAYNTGSQKERISLPGYSQMKNSRVAKKLLQGTSYESRQKLRSLLSFSSGKVSKKKYQLSSEQRQFICQEIADDLTELKTKHGIDLAEWQLENASELN